jgi:hypothetical protein
MWVGGWVSVSLPWRVQSQRSHFPSSPISAHQVRILGWLNLLQYCGSPNMATIFCSCSYQETSLLPQSVLGVVLISWLVERGQIHVVHFRTLGLLWPWSLYFCCLRCSPEMAMWENQACSLKNERPLGGGTRHLNLLPAPTLSCVWSHLGVSPPQPLSRMLSTGWHVKPAETLPSWPQSQDKQKVRPFFSQTDSLDGYYSAINAWNKYWLCKSRHDIYTCAVKTALQSMANVKSNISCLFLNMFKIIKVRDVK